MTSLAAVDIKTLISLRVIQAFNSAGTVNSFKNGDTSVLPQALIASLVTSEDAWISLSSLTGQPTSSAEKVKQAPLPGDAWIGGETDGR